MTLIKNAGPPSFQEIFAVGRALKKETPFESAASAQSLPGRFLLDDGQAKTPGFDRESGLRLVALLQSLVDGDASQNDLELETDLETFIELSIFDPYDARPTSFYFLLLSYSRETVDAYLAEMVNNIKSQEQNKRGLIIPDEKTYRKPKYAARIRQTEGILAIKRNEKPTLFMGVFPELNIDDVDPAVKIPRFLAAVSESLRVAKGETRPIIPVSAAFLLTFPRPVGPNPGLKSEFLGGGGLFVFGNYSGLGLPERQLQIQARLMKHVMKVSHTQADALLMVEDTERKGRIARTHELRGLIVRLDQTMPKCIFETIKQYFRLVVSFEHLNVASPDVSRLEDVINRAATKACEMAIAKKYVFEGIGKDWTRQEDGDVLIDFMAEVSNSISTLEVNECHYAEWERLSPSHVRSLFMGLVCLFRNVFLHGRLDLPVIVDLTKIDDWVVVRIANFTNEPLSRENAKPPICNTKQAGRYYVSEMGVPEEMSKKLFDFDFVGFDQAKQADEWHSTCPLPKADFLK